MIKPITNTTNLAVVMLLIVSSHVAKGDGTNCALAVEGLKLEHLLGQTFDEKSLDYIGDLRRVAWDAIHLDSGAYRQVVAEAFLLMHPEFPEVPENEFVDWVHRRVWTTMARDKTHGHRLPKVDRLKVLTQEVIDIQRKFAQP